MAVDSITYQFAGEKEASYATPEGTPALKGLQGVKECTIQPSPNTVRSESVAAGPRVLDVINTSWQASGQVLGEAVIPTKDELFYDMIVAALRGVPTTEIDYSGTDISFTITTNVISASSGSPFTNASPGQVIEIGGASTAAHNTRHTIVSVTDAQNIVVGTTLANESAGQTVTIKGLMIRDGKTVPSFGFEDYLTAGQIGYSNGAVVGGLTFNMSQDQIIQYAFDITARSFTRQASTIDDAGGYTDPTSTPLLDANDPNFDIFEAGTELVTNPMESMSLKINNNPRSRKILGSRFNHSVGSGQMVVECSFTTLFDDETLWAKFEAGTKSSLFFDFTDADGNGMRITLHRCAPTNLQVNRGKINSDVMVNATYEAVAHPTYDCSIQIDLFPAT